MEIRSLANTSFDELFLAFQKAFKDYEMQLNKQELLVMLNRRGFNPGLSFGAFENGRLLSFTFNGTGEYHGVKTAYDTGTGTIEEYRGQGLASRVFEHSLPFLRKAGIYQYVLEVLQHNKQAVSVYEKLGFKVSREFNYFFQTLKEIQASGKALNPAYRIQSMDLENQNPVAGFWDFKPSWQNDFAVINQNAGVFKMVGAYLNKTLVGYCIVETISGDLTQIAVEKSHRRQGIGSHLLKEILPEIQHSELKLINSETTCSSLTRFLESMSILPRGQQYEMVRTIGE